MYGFPRNAQTFRSEAAVRMLMVCIWEANGIVYKRFARYAMRASFLLTAAALVASAAADGAVMMPVGGGKGRSVTPLQGANTWASIQIYWPGYDNAAYGSAFTEIMRWMGTNIYLVDCEDPSVTGAVGNSITPTGMWQKDIKPDIIGTGVSAYYKAYGNSLYPCGWEGSMLSGIVPNAANNISSAGGITSGGFSSAGTGYVILSYQVSTPTINPQNAAVRPRRTLCMSVNDVARLSAWGAQTYGWADPQNEKVTENIVTFFCNSADSNNGNGRLAVVGAMPCTCGDPYMSAQSSPTSAAKMFDGTGLIIVIVLAVMLLLFMVALLAVCVFGKPSMHGKAPPENKEHIVPGQEEIAADPPSFMSSSYNMRAAHRDHHMKM